MAQIFELANPYIITWLILLIVFIAVELFTVGLTSIWFAAGALVALIIADEADAEAIKRIKKCKIYKNFMFSLKGWMEMHTALVTLNDNKIYHNRYGKSTGDYIKIHIDHYMAKCK